MKSDFILQNRISNDSFIDAQATKIIIDKLSTSLNANNHIVGFMHDVCLFPFGFMMFSELQVSSNQYVKKYIFRCDVVQINVDIEK